jgi:aminopeptidase
MPSDAALRAYAALTVRVGLNVQPDQRVLITGYRSGVDLDCAPFARLVVEAAYDAGARDVVVHWDDGPMRRLSMERMAADAVVAMPGWYPQMVVEHAQAGDAMLVIEGQDPQALAGLDPARLAARSEELSRRVRPATVILGSNGTRWSMVAAPTPAWARRVFPGVDEDVAVERLWDAILHAVRADRSDPVETWRAHVADLAARATHLTERAYRALRATGPGTEIVIGLADGHRWAGGAAATPDGVPFVPNLPTEEVFTAPHRLRVDGRVQGSRPVAVGGEMVDGWALTFRDGAVVEATASHGEASLRRLIATDPGASHLGEVALVAATSPAAETGLQFANTLFDENIACHVALGRSYPGTFAGSAGQSLAELVARGANDSLVHVDIMWGSDLVSVFGVLPDGSEEPLIVDGGWGW